MTPTEYCRNKEIQKYSTMYFSGSDGSKILRTPCGEYMSLSEMKSRYPTDPHEVKVINNFKGSNPDTTKEWKR